MSLPAETIADVPLGLSRDYDRLPRTGLLRLARYQTCDRMHEDVERQFAEGSRCLALMCRPCREQGRARWIAANTARLPRAIARWRS
jgi:hypothetical protein